MTAPKPIQAAYDAYARARNAELALTGPLRQRLADAYLRAMKPPHGANPFDPLEIIAELPPPPHIYAPTRDEYHRDSPLRAALNDTLIRIQQSRAKAQATIRHSVKGY